ncbi:indole-3-acetaldehyde oxidase-like [Teleopsis dalmanni]|uniref:indole-3-acetaldehyde oxidase-like n=1 Tax=Teleopsis dalmanni TaxID=139649 RepID=UPI0018CDEDBC|nr:indole-3-acetaldehyde oxidase-like [Teleopsis dalmanni]
MSTTSFVINGTPYTVNLLNFPPDITLNTFIREHAQLTATKFMCLEGGCGACICVIKGKHPATGELRIWAANSCLTLLNTCTNWEIITSEGIGSKRIGYHPIQKMLAKLNGSQCGFCSPGFVMNMYGLLESKNGKISSEEVENSFGGNICRCTGYRPILDAMKSFAADNTYDMLLDIEELNEKCCKKTANKCCPLQQKPLNHLMYEDESQWFWPKTIEELFTALNGVKEDEFMFVGGNTAHGVYRRTESIKSFIDINEIPELKTYTIDDETLSLGANLSLTEAMDIFKVAAQKAGFEYCEQLWKHFDLIANVPVRNNGTLAGNIATKKTHMEFPSDVFITFESLNAQVVYHESESETQTTELLEFLKLPEKKLLITAFILKAYPQENFNFMSYKIMPRAQNAHAYVNAGFLFEMDKKSGQVNSARICFGGIRPDFIHATAVENMLQNQKLFDQQTVAQIFKRLSEVLEPNAVLPDASPDYRKKLACGLFYKFLLNVAPKELVKEAYKSGGQLLVRPISSGSQKYDTNEKFYPVSQPVEKLEAMIQCAGEATYMNDTLTTNNSVYCAFVGATKVGAKIENIDATEALETPGVISFFKAKDIPGVNSFTAASCGYDLEEIFCSEKVKYYDQPLGVIVATSSDIANRATNKVKVIYSSENSEIFLDTAMVLQSGRTDRIYDVSKSAVKEIKLSEAADISGSGMLELGSQYHFTMEPQTTIAVPFEDGLQVWAATQWLDHTQAAIAQMLRINISSVQLRVRRLGGGYGSKITRGNQVACAASLVAFVLNRPARFVQTIESMMNSNGKRWACTSEYEFKIRSNAKITGLKNTFWQDAGCTLNENPVPVYSTLCSKNCYQFTANNFKLDGKAVLTDAASSAWCRAPGSVESIAMIENILEHIAFEAKVDPADARLVNLEPGNKMTELLPRFIKSTEYRARRKDIDTFNEKNRWRKRGLGLAIMEYPIIYLGIFTATVSIYHSDGTVVISHGGVEMGQGMNTKVAQVAAYVFGIPLKLVKIESTDTINGANSEVTGGSVGSESVCFAVSKTCNILNARLRPIREQLKKNATWQEVVQKAFQKSINLIASDCCKEGDLQQYTVYGLGLTEIEVDILTGNNMIRRVDIVEDTGESLSPFVDIGQIEGAFVMCLGYWLSENLVYDRQTGQLMTNRTWNYKPPGAKDIPIDFRIELLQKSKNQGGFMRSKATGEPPSCLAISVIFALQHAIQSARKDAGLKREWVRLGAPTTPETIVQMAGNDINKFSLE